MTTSFSYTFSTNTVWVLQKGLKGNFVAEIDGATTNVTEIQYCWGLVLSGML